MSTLFVGFTRDQTNVDLPVDLQAFHRGDPLPRAASTAVLCVDSCHDSPVLMERRQSDFNAMLRRGVRLVLVFGRHSHLSPAPPRGAHSGFFTWLASKIGLFEYPPLPHGVEAVAERTELRDWFSEQSATVVVTVNAVDVVPLATAIRSDGSPIGVASARWTSGRSEVVVIPHRDAAAGYAVAVTLSFLRAMPGREDVPEYLDAMVTADDAQLMARLQQLDEKKQAVLAKLSYYRSLKRILYQSGTDLEIEVVRFLSEELNVPARRVGGSAEDFWLTDRGEDWCIGEVKSAERRNLERHELRRLALHRSEVGKEDDDPSLLVANTFFRASTLEERDQPIASNQVSYAVRDHIAIVRTLDLFRLKQLELQLGGDVGGALRDFVGSGGGWLEVTPELEIIQHR